MKLSVEDILRLLHLGLDFLDNDRSEGILVLELFEQLDLELGVPVEPREDLVDFKLFHEAVVLWEVDLLKVKPTRLFIVVGQAAVLAHVGGSPVKGPVLLRCKQGRVAG